MNKVTKDGMVAVLISPDFGAGWYTWNTDEGEELIFDPELVAAVEANDYQLANEIVERKWPNAYTGGLSSLKVQWLPIGTKFLIHEYDGSESIWLAEDLTHTA